MTAALTKSTIRLINPQPVQNSAAVAISAQDVQAKINRELVLWLHDFAISDSSNHYKICVTFVSPSTTPPQFTLPTASPQDNQAKKNCTFVAALSKFISGPSGGYYKLCATLLTL